MRQGDAGGRAAWLMAGLLVGVALLLLQLAELQLKQHAQFSQVALSQRLHSVKLEAPRGDILDRKGRKLVTSRPAYRLLILYPSYIAGGEGGSVPSRELRRVAALFGVDPTGLESRARERIESQRFFEPLVVKHDLSPREAALAAEIRSVIPGLYLDVHPMRHYLLGSAGAHVLGHLGPIDQEELSQLASEGYSAGDQIGKLGLERQYDQVLRGRPGRLDLEVDAAFRPTHRSVQGVRRTAGTTIQTTLDLDLQQALDSALVRTLRYVSKTPDWNGVMFPYTNAGAAVVMDVRTGGILAMSSYPAFDPSLYTGVRTEGVQEAIDRAGRNPLSPMFNRAIAGEYLPGSTWKMVTAAAALENGVVDPQEGVECHGVFDKIEPKLDWKPDGHGEVNTVSALAHSCNIYFYEMGYRLGVDPMASMAQRFGFGSPTGVDLPGETGGWIPDEERRAEHPDTSSWEGGKLLSAAIGQGPTATPLQLVRYASIIANGGLLVQPHLATAVLDENGRLVEELVPQSDSRIAVSPNTLALLRQGMRAVTEYGTSSWAFAGLPITVAGKTGTAEVTGAAHCHGEPKCQYGLYVAYAPAENPEIAIAVVGERAGHGDSINPVARAIFAEYFGLELAESDPLYTMGILERQIGTKSRGDR